MTRTWPRARDSLMPLRPPLMVWSSVIEGDLVVLAELFGDGVKLLEALNVHDRVLDDVAVLDILAADLNELACVSAVRSDELGDDSHHLAAVDGELRTRTPESLVTQPE